MRIGGRAFERAATEGRDSRNPLSRKKIATPKSMRPGEGPRKLLTLNVETLAEWVSRMLSAATARSASSSGKRGLPGGGVSAGEGAATTRPAYAWAVRRPDAFELRLAAIAGVALAIRVAAA